MIQTQRQNVYDSYLEAALKKFKPKDLELYDLKKWKFDYVGVVNISASFLQTTQC